jgi:hypothetical protein
MTFAEMLERVKAGGRVRTPQALLPNCVVYIGAPTETHPEAALCMQSANGKIVRPWAPNLEAMLSDDWQAE